MLRQFHLLLISFLIAASSSVVAHADDTNIGFVNIDRVLREAPSAIKASKRLEQKFEGRRKELQQMEEDIRSRNALLLEKGSALSASQRRAKEEELTTVTAHFQRKQQEFLEDVKSAQNEETSAIFQKANEAIVQIASARHLDLILQDAVSFSSRLDITEEVIKKLSSD